MNIGRKVWEYLNTGAFLTSEKTSAINFLAPISAVGMLPFIPRMHQGPPKNVSTHFYLPYSCLIGLL